MTRQCDVLGDGIFSSIAEKPPRKPHSGLNQKEHRLSHYFDMMLDRMLTEPCWYTAIDHSGAAIGMSVNLRVQSTWWNRLMPWFRTSWCYECGWHGLLRPDPRPLAPESVPTRHTEPVL